MSEILELTDQEFDEYLTISLANYQRVTPGERKRLRGLIRHYAKMKHPFTQCVRDNTKRFGKERAERICAVLKDLIKGTTKWRGEERRKNLSEDAARELFGLDVDDSFYHYIEELSDEEIAEIMAEEEVGLSDDRELVLAELFFGADDATIEEDGLLYKTIFREGIWKYSPGPGQKPVDKPLTVVKEGQSDKNNLVISMAEIKDNFEKGAKDSVTVPLNHDNRPHENTGYIKKLKFDTDSQGRTVLKAGFHFTEPDIKEKAQRGTIPGTSGGVIFDYIHKEKGDKFGAVLDHVALTPNPWLNGMEPFGMSGDNVTIIAFSEEHEEEAGGEPNVSETTDETKTLEQELGLSADEIKATIAEAKRLRAEAKERSIRDKIKAWQEKGVTPAVLEQAERALLADDGAVALNLSENGTETSLTLSDMVERLVNAMPVVNLTEGTGEVNDEKQTGEKPEEDVKNENDKVKLSAEEKVEVTALMFDEGVKESEAIARVVAKRESK